MDRVLYNTKEHCNKLEYYLLHVCNLIGVPSPSHGESPEEYNVKLDNMINKIIKLVKEVKDE